MNRELDKSTFKQQMERIQQVTSTSTQRGLATFLGVPQSAVAYAKRRRKVPAGWLVTLICAKDVHPEWILTGKDPCYVLAAKEQIEYSTVGGAQIIQDKKDTLHKLSSKYLADELLRRITISQENEFIR